MAKRPEVFIIERERMSLIGLMLGGIIAGNLSDSKKTVRARKLRGNLGVTAGKMRLTIQFRGDRIELVRGNHPPLKAAVRGSLNALLHVSLGQGVLRSLLSGGVSLRGSPFFALRVLPLLQVQTRAEDER